MININKLVSAGLALISLALIAPLPAAAWSPTPYNPHESLTGVLSEEIEGYPRPGPSDYNGCVLTRQPVTDIHGTVIGFYDAWVCN